ncbi:metallophosphoesterase [Streptomyces rugosispiralis]|uniref:Metallophosphoesterase n=1 Tax=Streptomyces rugosispiralis TaxID=2967341 RepID=A0ABT1UZK8_9ACTN|nr:metallophosphoesterase [Streptomyces rugosispiralis]MCQ8190572.1 metallophosphoesterase [Streptomyces rugosispiralis]
MVEGSMTQGAGLEATAGTTAAIPPVLAYGAYTPPGMSAPGAVPPGAVPPGSVPAAPGTTAPVPQPAPAPEAPVPGVSAPGAPAPGAPAPDAPTPLPAEYTPTERLPVLGPGHTIPDTPLVPPQDRPTVALTTVPEPEDGPLAQDEGPGPLYVVGDVHGYHEELREALAAEGLIDAKGNWSAGNARLWFLGDFTDRGPDGIGVIDLVMQLSAEAAAAGGYCKALMGNHELLLIGAKRFGDTPVNSGAGTASFQAAWLLNGGQRSDMERLEDHHLQWMSRLDAMAEEDGHLLVHSDTTAYLDYGDSIEAVNDTVTETLQRSDADECWDLFRKFTKRFAFRDEDAGPTAVRELLDAYGGERIVHGHSPIPYLLGEVGSEDGEDGGTPAVEGPHVYADNLAVAMDGGITMAGKLLVVQLPLPN